MILNLILLTLALGIFITAASIIHRKRYGRNYIASYHWYTRILK
jgi:hypothetical protein